MARGSADGQLAFKLFINLDAWVPVISPNSAAFGGALRALPRPKMSDLIQFGWILIVFVGRNSIVFGQFLIVLGQILIVSCPAAWARSRAPAVGVGRPRLVPAVWEGGPALCVSRCVARCCQYTIKDVTYLYWQVSFVMFFIGASTD